VFFIVNHPLLKLIDYLVYAHSIAVFRGVLHRVKPDVASEALRYHEKYGQMSNLLKNRDQKVLFSTDVMQPQRWFPPILPQLTLSCPPGLRRAAHPDIPSFCLLRESGGEQLLSSWLMALWTIYAYPAEPFVLTSRF